MNLRSIRWQLPISYAGIALLAALTLGAVLISTLRSYYNELEQRYLQGNAEQISLAMGQLLKAQAPDFVIHNQVSSWGFMLQARLQLFDAGQNLLADSGSPDMRQVMVVSNSGDETAEISGTPQSLQVYISPADPSVSAGGGFSETRALAVGCTGSPQAAGCTPNVVYFASALTAPVTTSLSTAPMEAAIAFAPLGVAMPMGSSLYGFDLSMAGEETIQRSTQVVEQAVLGANGAVLGTIHLSEGPGYGGEIVNSVVRGWLAASLAAVTLAALAGWWVSRRLTAPLLLLTEATRRMADGDLGTRVAMDTPAVGASEEFEHLGYSFNKMAARVEETVQTLKDFVSDAAHELHTPLTALRTNLELASQELARPEPSASTDPIAQEQFLAAAQEQTLRLESLVNDLLQLSRLESSRPAHVLLDLNAIAGAQSEIYASRAEQKGIEFSAGRPSSPVPVRGEHQQLQRLLSNLLENALKFTPTGGQIELGLTLEAGWACLRVADNGIGIPTADLPELFQRFHRGRNAAAFPGSGLGLAIAQTIAQAHGGRIEARSDGAGAIFVVRLPVEVG